ncbi:LacI family DNA-binding transcriptional regulator [Streptomyces sp. AC627_RSS907]|uniref:LacI family DNA-binding transcriptional regulator n=1 Tax=Streptomyces sp. AC627_RSS907 TaxID=2823684 RepID=UPI001C22E10D|nr:LacI family DNA-binding transcriptional regulator [Streptomyces sp. AC627_RSS907]
MVQIPNTPDSASPSAPRSVPTSADVARLAGVSRATVSYVLNNTSAVRISEPTRRRVHEAARELGYVPHAAARSLRAGHSRMVLMPAPSFPAGPLYSRFLTELQWALGRLDYTVVQYGTVGLRGDEAARAWAEMRPVAVLVPGSGLGPRGVELLRRSGARAVVTLGPDAVEGAHALLMDHEAVGHSAARHLHDRGRRRIGVLLPAEEGLEVFSLPRLAGARRAVHGTGATVTEVPLAYEERDAARLAARWRSLGLDAVFAYNDEYAMLLMRALQDEGLAVPGDVAVIGADDLMLGRLLRPRLSTVHLELPSGHDLAALVDRVVHDPDAAPERHEVLGAAVVHRESS